MEDKKLFLSFALIFIIFSSPALFAQESAPQENAEETIAKKQGAAQAETAEANELRQPFSWESAGDALKYEITIRKYDEKTKKYIDCYTHETNEEETASCLIYIDPILPQGTYQSTIKVYNVLGTIEEELTNTDDFIVRRAYRPEVKSVSYPLYMRSVIYLDDFDNDGVILVDGKNLFMPDPQRQEMTFTDYILKSEKRTLVPEKILSHDEKNKSIKFQFDMKKLDVGNYHLIAMDASGLHSNKDSDSLFIVKFKKWMDLDIEAGYVCPIVLHDDTFPTYMFNTVYPMSAQGRISFMPFKHSWGYLGIGLRLSGTRLETKQSGYTIDGNLLTGHALFVYQLPLFKRRVMAEAHIGAGVTYFNNILFHFPHNIDSEALNTISPSLDVGLASQIYINKRLYSEVACDYIFTLNKDMTLGLLMPSLGIGWQF